MLIGHIYISTTWAASTSYIPFPISMQAARNSTNFATTARVIGLWGHQVHEEGWRDYMESDNQEFQDYADVLNLSDEPMQSAMNGMGSFDIAGQDRNAFYSGMVVEANVRKLKAIRVTPNRSGIQVDRKLVKGNELVFQYEALGELVRP